MLLLAAFALQAGQSGRYALPASEIWKMEVKAGEAFRIPIKSTDKRVPVLQQIVGDMPTLNIRRANQWYQLADYDDPARPGIPLVNGVYEADLGTSGDHPVILLGYWAPRVTPSPEPAWSNEFPALDRLWVASEAFGTGELTVGDSKHILTYAGSFLYRRELNGQLTELSLRSLDESPVGYVLSPGKYVVPGTVSGYISRM